VQGVIAVAVIAIIGTTVYLSSVTNRGGDLIEYKSVKKDFDAGKYTESAKGVISLAPSDRTTTIDGYVYVSGSPPTLMLFPRWRGEGSSVVATGWSAAPLKKGEEVDANIPGPPENPTDASPIISPTVTMKKVRVIEDLGEQWYVFERRAE
jgi:hypothetical protein